MSSSPPTTAELLAVVRAYVRENFPQLVPSGLRVHFLNSEEDLNLPIPVASVASVSSPSAPALFTPNELQDNILEALDRKVLHAEALADAVGVSRRALYRHPGGIKELMEQGAVYLHSRLGYYRRDAAPEDLPDE